LNNWAIKWESTQILGLQIVYAGLTMPSRSETAETPYHMRIVL